MSAITTHVLDTSAGRPAQGVRVVLSTVGADGSWTRVADGATDGDGRVSDLLDDGVTLSAGTYSLRFETGEYFEAQGADTFYPFACIHFRVQDPSQHYHVPLLLSPYGYSTYRGS